MEHKGDGQNQCPICKKFIINNINVEDHKEEHDDDGDWSFDDCYFQFNNEQALQKHVDLTSHSSDT